MRASGVQAGTAVRREFETELAELTEFFRRNLGGGRVRRAELISLYVSPQIILLILSKPGFGLS